MILLEYIYGLPQKPKVLNLETELKKWGLNWCQHIVNSAEDWDSDSLIDFLTGNMLKLDAHDRLSAGDCLREASALGLFDGVFLKTGHVTPRLQPVPIVDEIDQEDQSTLIRSRVWTDGSGFLLRRDENATEPMNTIPISPRKDATTFVMSSIPQINGQYDGELSREDCEDRTEYIRGSHKKYRRTSRHDRIPSLPSLPPNDIDVYDSVDRLTVLGNYATEQNSLEYTNTRVGDNFVRCIQMSVRGKTVSMCESDGSLNAVQILNLTLSDSERHTILESIKEHSDPRSSLWISFEKGRSLCYILNLGRDLKPLLDLGATGRAVATTSPDSGGQSEYFQVGLGDRHVRCRRSDLWVNATKILRVAGHKRHELSTVKARHPDMRVEIVKGHAQDRGTYVSFLDGLWLCREYQVQELRQLLVQELVSWLYAAESRDVQDTSVDFNKECCNNEFDGRINTQTETWAQSQLSHLDRTHPSLEAGKSPPNYANSIQEELENNTDPIQANSVRCSLSTREEPVNQVEPIQDEARGNPSHRSQIQALQRHGQYIAMRIDGFDMSLRIADGWFNLNQLMSLICYRQPSLNRASEVFRFKEPKESTSQVSLWISCNDVVELCKRYLIFEDLRPIIELGQSPEALARIPVAPAGDVGAHSRTWESSVDKVKIPVFLDRKLVNINRIFLAAGEADFIVKDLKNNNPHVLFTTETGQDHYGTFAELSFGRKVCEHFGLWEVAWHLETLQTPDEQEQYRFMEAFLPERRQRLRRQQPNKGVDDRGFGIFQW